MWKLIKCRKINVHKAIVKPQANNDYETALTGPIVEGRCK